jgi:hypothetical protein
VYVARVRVEDAGLLPVPPWVRGCDEAVVIIAVRPAEPAHDVVAARVRALELPDVVLIHLATSPPCSGWPQTTRRSITSWT